MFSRLIEYSLRNRLIIMAAAVVLMVMGTLTLMRTPVDVFPDLDRPTVTVMTEAGGMAPEEVEQLISIPLESTLNGMPGVSSVRSISGVGLSFVYVQFDYGTDIYRARQNVAERLALAREQMPADVAPAMGPITSIMGEIMLVAIPLDPARIEPMVVREFADFVLRPRLLTVPGIAQVIPIGGEVRQFQVQPDTALMAHRGVTLEQIEAAVRGFSSNTAGGFLELNAREYLIRNLGRTSRLDDLRTLPVAFVEGQPILLSQVAKVAFAPSVKRGDGGFNGRPAVILGIAKQPGVDTVKLTHQVEAALASLSGALPPGVEAPRTTMRQASFIEASVGNLQSKLMTAAVVVALVLYAFMGNARTTLISLTAIPLSFVVAGLVFHGLGLTINTMTLGGLAIAIGELVDDAVVDLENIQRRLRLNRQLTQPRPVLDVIWHACVEVRSGVVVATMIIVLVFVPLMFLPGLEGRLFVPLGTAYMTAILASLLVATTVTPVLAYFLLPRLRQLDHAEPRLVQWIKGHYERALGMVLRHARAVVSLAAVAVVLAAASVPFFATAFLPPFNEGALMVGVRLMPGTTLAESVRLASTAENLLRTVPEVEYVGRRSGRAELDEHAEGVHVSELDVRLRPSDRDLETVIGDMRQRLRSLPANISIGAPLSHRIDHMLSGVSAQIALKIFGDDLDTLRAQAQLLRDRLSEIPGLADLNVERQVLTPQITVQVDHERAAQHGLSPARLLTELQMLIDGEKVAQIIEGNRRFDLVLRLPDAARGPQGLEALMIDTPSGRVPLSQLATVGTTEGPNEIRRDDGRRRIVISGSAQDRPLSAVVSDIRRVIAQTPLPAGYFVTVGGQFQAQEEASRLIALLSLVSAALVFLVLYSRYRSVRLGLMIMANIPLALVGAVIGLWLSGQPLSIAALIGFITLAGIATRNGILKVSHYINLCVHEGEQFGPGLLVRGALERLTPVLMTALVAALALAPLLFEADQPGTEILHPVAVVIFSGLISATLLDVFVTPAMVSLFGRRAIESRVAEARDAMAADPRQMHTF